MNRDRLERMGLKTAVITGSGSGLGRALALNLARDGWAIGIVDVNAAGARATLDLVEEAGGSGEVFECDVRDADRVEGMAGHFFDAWGGVSLLVNNAGIAAAGFVGDAELSEWRRIVDINLFGPVNGCHAFVPRMKAQGFGHVINVASSAGIMNLPEMGPYNVTKAATISLSETLRTELACENVLVTVACPTFFDTNLLDGMTCTDEFQSEFARSAFSNSKVTTDDIAFAIIDGARKGKMYVLPQFSAKWTWFLKRTAPSTWLSAISLGYRLGIARAFIMWMSRRGWV
jgi:NAD(P)-dependent dehydrogenase (short-subunit alcohol dehydrogenase family)